MQNSARDPSVCEFEDKERGFRMEIEVTRLSVVIVHVC